MRNIARALSLALPLSLYATGALAQSAPPSLPAPSSDPLQIDISKDPILLLAREEAPRQLFNATIAAAVEHHPATQEAIALTAQAGSVIDEAIERRMPSVDVNVTSYRVIARDFSNDPNNIIERSRASQRTDASLQINQNILDFGASGSRVNSARARFRSAAADAEGNAEQTAMNGISAWYDVFAYRALVTLSEAFVKNQQELREAVAERIRQGVSAQGDTARVDSYLASAQTRLASFRRQLSSAEARLSELTGTPPPAQVLQPPAPLMPTMTQDAVAMASMRGSASRSAQALADSARQEARASRADRLPQIGVGIDAGRYGVFENATDFDIRGLVTMRQHLFGGTEARLAQAQAKARSADAHAARIREESARDASIAWSDVRALEEQLTAMEASYIASRRSRDVLIERFINSRGDLFDVVQSESSYFETATSYIQALTQLGAARYILLARMGQLLPTLGIEPEKVGGRSE
ncbi:MAG: TolC family protein [Alphaproteobacteria bacterium]|nr:TolC family protein [Alphaproteobacteria bacterium]MDB5719437.1 TolC family protein [Alphaproteobacteria bacterium]